MMKEKTSVKKTVAISVGTRVNNTQPKKRFVLYWRVCEDKIALLSCVDEKVFIQMNHLILSLFDHKILS